MPHLGTGHESAFGVYSPSAYWTPPVRGEDRVHLSDLRQIKVLTNLLFARRSGPRA